MSSRQAARKYLPFRQDLFFGRTYYTTRLIVSVCYKQYTNTYNPCVLKNNEVLIKKQLVYYILSIFPGLPDSRLVLQSEAAAARVIRRVKF